MPVVERPDTARIAWEADGPEDAPAVLLDNQAHDGRIGVLADVGQRLLEDAQQLDLRPGRKRLG